MTSMSTMNIFFTKLQLYIQLPVNIFTQNVLKIMERYHDPEIELFFYTY